MGSFIKICPSCGTVYDEQSWNLLPASKRNNGIWLDDEGNPHMEQRDCPCGSSIVIDIRNKQVHQAA